MQQPNAKDLIQQLKDYFKAEYGLTVNINISAHDHIDRHITAETAMEKINEISEEIGSRPLSYQRGKYQWVSSSKEGCCITIFYPDDPQTS